MSVDFYSCDYCEDSIYKEYVGHCADCGHSICTNCLVNDDVNSRYEYDYRVKCDGTEEQAEEYGFELSDYKIGKVIEDSGIDPKYCPFCNGKKVHNDDLLEFILKKYKLNKDEEIKAYKKSKKRSNKQ